MQHYSAVKGHVGLQLDSLMWTGYCKNTKRWTCLTRSLFCKLCWGKSLTRAGNCVYLHLQSQSELTLMCRISDGGSWGFPAGDGGWGMHLSPEWPAAALWRRWMRNAHCCCAEEWEEGSFSEPALGVLRLPSLGVWALGWLTAGVSITFAFVLANKCAVLVWLAFHTQVFFILTVTVYLDTIGCVVAELLSEWNKRFFLLTGVTGSRCTK